MAYCDYRTRDTDHEWCMDTTGDHVTRDQIRFAYGGLAAAREAAYKAAEAFADAKENLEFERSQLLLAGMIQGKNEAEREARARELLADQIKMVRAAQREADLTRYELDLATQEVEKVKLLLRLDELEAYAAAGVHHERQ